MMSDLSTDAEGAVLTRRRFFEGLAVIGGLSLAMAGMDALGYGFTSAAAEPPALTGGAKKKKVVILGAGLAGMTAAYELTKAGYNCEILESRSFAGGRCQTIRGGTTVTDLAGNTQTCEFDEGLYLNNGPWRIPYHHRSTLHYTKLFGVPLEIFVNDNDASYVYFEKGSGPLSKKPIRKGQIAADARGHTAELMAKVASRGGLDDAISAADRDLFIAYLMNEGWLSPKDLHYGGTGGRGYDVDPGAGVNPGAGIASSPYTLTDVLNAKAWQVLTSVSEYDQQRTMFQPTGGMDQIAKGFERHVGSMIRYSSPVEKIRQSGSGVTVSYHDAKGAKGEIKADYCLCTIPLSVLRQMDGGFSKTFKAAMDQVAYAPVNKIGLQMKRRFWEEDHAIYGGHIYTDMPGIGSMSFPSTGWQSQKGIILGFYDFGADAARISAKKPADRTKFALAAGQKVFPEYTESFENAFSFSWHLEKNNLGGWAEWSEDARKTAYPVLLEPDGRIYLAGEHLTYTGAWQASAIESAWQQIAKLHARVHHA
jgi:monoamine oxidase